MLRHLREHPCAPLYRNQSGNRLTAEDLAAVRREESDVLSARVGWPPDGVPDWLPGFVERCRAEVPHYRRYGTSSAFHELPTITRADLGHDIARFVPDSVPLERLINFQTSGATGHPLLVPSHPRVAAGYLAYHKRALRRFGVTLTAGPGEVGVVLIGYQLTCFTYVSVTPAMDEAGLAKINLHPRDWRRPEDRAAYLEALRPEVIAGDPLSFAELLTITSALRPKALLSTSMTLLPALREKLSAAYGCPVLDLYSLNEAGPVAVFDAKAGGHVLLQPNLFVEILDPDDQPVAPGQRGEIALTGGFNFCLPLLRYRTGDFSSIDLTGEEPVLHGFEGRSVIRFRRADGTWINNIDVTHALRPLPLTRFSLHQRKDGAFEFFGEGPPHALTDANAALIRLLGAASTVLASPFPGARERGGKILQYTSDLPEASR